MKTFVDMRNKAIEIIKRLPEGYLRMHMLDAAVLFQWDRCLHLEAVMKEYPGVNFGEMVTLECLLLNLREGPTMDSMPAKQTDPPALHRCSSRVRSLATDDNEFNSLHS